MNDDATFVATTVLLGASEDGMMGMFCSDSGKVTGGLEVEVFTDTVPGRGKWSKVSLELLGRKGRWTEP